MVKVKKWNTMVWAMIPICIAINFVGAQIANALKLPMYLDVIGTIMMGAFCGPIPGVVLAVLSTLINSIAAPASIAYLPVTISFGLLAGWFGSKGYFTKLHKTIIAGVVLAAVGVIISTPITVFLYGGITGTGQSVIIMGMQAVGIGLVPATIISGLITEIADKLISAFIVFSVGKALSDRQLSKLPQGQQFFKRNVTNVEEQM